jgi:hypothetical protein
MEMEMNGLFNLRPFRNASLEGLLQFRFLVPISNTTCIGLAAHTMFSW